MSRQSLILELENAIELGSHSRCADVLRRITDLFLSTEEFEKEKIELYDDVIERPDVMGRCEAHEHVRSRAVEAFQDFTCDLADRLDGCRMERERGRVAVHEVHSQMASA